MHRFASTDELVVGAKETRRRSMASCTLQSKTETSNDNPKADLAMESLEPCPTMTCHGDSKTALPCTFGYDRSDCFVPIARWWERERSDRYQIALHQWFLLFPTDKASWVYSLAESIGHDERN